jgi:hypothetical protein
MKTEAMSGFARHIPQRASPLLTRRRPVVEGALGRFGASAGGNSGIPRVRILSIQLSNSRPESSPLGVERGAVAACLRHSRLIQAGPLEQPLDSVEVEVHAPPRAHTPAGFRVAPIHRQIRRARWVTDHRRNQLRIYPRRTIREGDEALRRCHPYRHGCAALS